MVEKSVRDAFLSVDRERECLRDRLQLGGKSAIRHINALLDKRCVRFRQFEVGHTTIVTLVPLERI